MPRLQLLHKVEVLISASMALQSICTQVQILRRATIALIIERMLHRYLEVTPYMNNKALPKQGPCNIT